MNSLFINIERYLDGAIPVPIDHGIEASDGPSMSPIEALIVEILLEKDIASAAELIAASNGTLKLGTAYVTLQRMLEKGFVTRPSARTYAATTLGARFYRAHHLIMLINHYTRGG